MPLHIWVFVFITFRPTQFWPAGAASLCCFEWFVHLNLPLDGAMNLTESSISESLVIKQDYVTLEIQSSCLFNYVKSLTHHSNPFSFQLLKAFNVLNAFNSFTMQGTQWDIFFLSFSNNFTSLFYYLKVNQVIINARNTLLFSFLHLITFEHLQSFL